MAKKYKKKHYGALILVLCMILYAMAFLAVTAYGLEYLWSVMEAYEGSRTHIAIDSYMEQLDADYVCGKSQDLIDQIDHNIQSEENCRQVITDFLKNGFSYAKKSSECTDTKQVYVLRSGGKVIGEFQIEMQGQTVHGFTPWVVTGDSFDLSFLRTGTVSTLAPHDYPVYVNGALLTEDYITQTDIQYDVLSDFYEDYTVPYMVTYEAGPCLGEISLQVTTPGGEPITIDENTDVSIFLDNCTQDELTQLNAFVEEYIFRYVTFMANHYGNAQKNYNELVKYILPGTTLEKRMDKSIEGLIWIYHTKIEIDQITMNRTVALGDDKYLCDVSYTATLSGSDKTDGDIQLIIVRTDDGLKAETMLSY